jgi:subtilisin family serine protease
MNSQKIAPALLAVLDDVEAFGDVALTMHSRSVGVARETAAKPPRVPLFLQCDADADLSHLEQYGVRLNQTRGRVRTAFAPLSALDALSEDAAVKRIIPSRYLSLRLDVAPGRVHMPAFASSTGLTGRNTIVGIVDSGIDSTHPAFAGRILRVWDQVIPGPGTPEGDYGVELTSAAAMTASRDLHGHGTHVAGIAAGSDNTFGGIAPDADLVIVRSDLQNTHIADGIRYIMRVATDLNRPAVVNLSLGGHFDAHDGSDALSQIIDDASGPGRIVCCAAGNEGTDNIHGRVTLAAGQTGALAFQVPLTTGDTTIPAVALNGWYSGGDHLEVAVASPGGFTTPFQPVVSAGNPLRRYLLPDGRVQIITPGPNPANGDHQFIVQVTAASGGDPVEDGTWRLLVKAAAVANGVVDSWILTDGVTFTAPSDELKIGSPGAAAQAITVASFTTKVAYRDIDGTPRTVQLALDDISSFSSPGPLRNRARKPDLTAPGAMIVSCLSRDSRPRRASMVNDQFVAMAGTSMATPFVSGVVALLLQASPALTAADVKSLLTRSARIPGQVAGAFDSKWGFGLLDGAALATLVAHA